jgi:hypothetical protein
VAEVTQPLLHVWLVADESDGRAFLADIHKTLRRLVQLSGMPFENRGVRWT